MSRNDIDEAIYDQERYESLRARGVSEGRAKRVGTVPLRRDPAAPRRQADTPPFGDGIGVNRTRVEEQPIRDARVSTTTPRTGI